MIRDIELLQGAALLRVLQFKPGVQVTQMMSLHSSLYKVDSEQHKSAILLKLSTRKKAPWQYVFSEFEQRAIAKISADGTSRIFIGLICSKDGICCISARLLKQVMGGETFARKALSVYRSQGTSYRITGPQRKKFRRTFPVNLWPRIIFEET